MIEKLSPEQADLYRQFEDVSEGLEVVLDPAGLYMSADEEDTIDELVDEIESKRGELESLWYEIKVLAAIAFWKTADIVPMECIGSGGEKYDDD
jgi:hypothetical protein